MILINMMSYQPQDLYNLHPRLPFENGNFENKNNIFHNNLNKNLLDENIREYSILIDSKDRNYQIYPDPFNYQVIFNPLHKTSSIVQGKKIVYEDPNPTIYTKLNNVKYIKLDDIILPFYTKIVKYYDIVEDKKITKYKVDIKNQLIENLYTVLDIGDNFKDMNYKSSNDLLSDSFAVIYFSSKINDTHFRGISKNAHKVFSKDQLGKIDKLKINFTDPYGNAITCNHVRKEIKSNLICSCNDEIEEDNICFKHNLFHPLNPIFQHHLHFKVGIIESNLNKNIFL